MLDLIVFLWSDHGWRYEERVEDAMDMNFHLIEGSKLVQF